MRQSGEAQMTARPDLSPARTAVLGGLVALLVTLGLAFCPRSVAYASTTVTRPAPSGGVCLLHFDSRSVGPGEAHLLVGAGLGPGETVDVSQAGATVGRVTADARGAFSFTLHSPPVLRGAFWPIDVASTAHACSVRPAVASSDAVHHNARHNRLAAAGFPAIAAAMAGAFLAGCGLLFLTVGRRRRI